MINVDYKKRKKNILTLGSCLSRFVALQYYHLFGAKPICSIFNNRSDLFIKYHLKNEAKIFSLDYLLQFVPLSKEKQTCFLRQTSEFLGIHDPFKANQTQINFESCVTTNHVDIIFIDNYVDITGKSVYLEFHPDLEFFITVPKDDKEGLYKNLIVNDYISINDSMINFMFIVKKLKEFFPDARIIFLNFPYEYYDSSKIAYKRFKKFSDNFECSDLDIHIDCHLFSNYFQTGEHQHFTPPLYASIAGVIYSGLSSKYSFLY